MQSIYSRPFAVIVWLGEAAEESERAIDFMAEMTRYSLCYGKSWERGGYKREVDDNFVGQLEEQLPEMPWKALLSFLSRTYWQRLWIIQELALNHNMTLFLCGERQLSRDMIRRACEFCMRNSTSIDRVIVRNPEKQHISFKQTSSIWSTVYQVEGLITILSQASEIETLDVILNLSRNARVTNSRDKIYGLLALLPEPLAREITVDYDLSQEEVYAQFAAAMLRTTKIMDPLFSWCSFQTGASCPSWIPDWTAKFARNRIKWLKRRNASASTPGLWSISEDGLRLHSRGFIVDTVESTSASQSESIPYRTELPKLSGLPRFSEYLTGDTVKENLAAALRRTLSCGATTQVARACLKSLG